MSSGTGIAPSTRRSPRSTKRRATGPPKGGTATSARTTFGARPARRPPPRDPRGSPAPRPGEGAPPPWARLTRGLHRRRLGRSGLAHLALEAVPLDHLGPCTLCLQDGDLLPQRDDLLLRLL